MLHLYEVAISNSRVWLKVQASCVSSEHSAVFFECRFTGTDYDRHRPVVSAFKLSQRSHYIANWASVMDRLPAGWDDDEFHIVGAPYPWCETLSDDCDCHGSEDGLAFAYCSDFGLHDEAEKMASKSQNVMYLNYIQRMEEVIVRRDESQREERLEREQRSPPRGAAPLTANPVGLGGALRGVTYTLAGAIIGVHRLVDLGFYCSIEGHHHPYGNQAIQKTMASLTSVYEQLSTWDGAERDKAMSTIGYITEHWLQRYQSEECAQRSLWGDVDIPDIVYKYIPKERIGKGAPDSLRASQLLAPERRYGMQCYHNERQCAGGYPSFSHCG